MNFSRIKPAIEKTTHRIKHLPEKQKPFTELKQDLISHLILCEKELLGENEQQVKLYTEKYAESIIANIYARFPEDTLSVLGSFSIFNVENFHSSSNSEQVILIDCMIFLSPFLDVLDVTRMSMSTVSFLTWLNSGILCL